MKTLDVPEVPKPVSIDDEAKRLVDTYNKKMGQDESGILTRE